MIQSIRSALAFFSRLPVGKAPLLPTLSGVTVWLPLVGIILGIILSGIVILSQSLFPPLLVGLIGCGAWIMLTGGLHLDGVADCGDGLLVETTPSRRLEILKDSRLGTFGALALFFVLMCKTITLYYLSVMGLDHLVQALILACVLGRTQIFLLMGIPSARPGGMGDAVRQGTSKAQRNLGLLIALALSLLTLPYGPIAFLLSVIFAVGISRASIKRLGGTTGDVYGCSIELTECIVLLSFCMNLHTHG